jgi:hypothetical protein
VIYMAVSSAAIAVFFIWGIAFAESTSCSNVGEQMPCRTRGWWGFGLAGAGLVAAILGVWTGWRDQVVAATCLVTMSLLLVVLGVYLAATL